LRRRLADPVRQECLTYRLSCRDDCVSINMCAFADNVELARPEVSGLFESVLAGGYSVRVQVTGRSMRPFLQGDEVLIIEPVGSRRLRVGAIVLFKDGQDQLVIHRIIQVRETSVQTQGDALNEPDPSVDITRIMGKVERVEKGQSQLDLESWAQRIRGWMLASSSLWRWRIRRVGSVLKTRLRNG
jgi:signal peptidase I